MFLPLVSSGRTTSFIQPDDFKHIDRARANFELSDPPSDRINFCRNDQGMAGWQDEERRSGTPDSMPLNPSKQILSLPAPTGRVELPNLVSRLAGVFLASLLADERWAMSVAERAE